MGISAEVRDEAGGTVALEDPALGGTFNASGDFDRLIGTQDGGTAVLAQVDPYEITVIRADLLPELLGEARKLETAASEGPERHGAMRLVAQIAHCLEQPRHTLVFVGD